MTIKELDEFYELSQKMLDCSYLYSICQHDCDGMGSCKMFAEPNNKGCLKMREYYLKLRDSKSENLKD